MGTRRKPMPNPKDANKMTFKEKVEKDPFLWIIRVAIAAFGIGFGTYQVILTTAQLDVIRKGTYVKREEYDLLKTELEKLKGKDGVTNKEQNNTRKPEVGSPIKKPSPTPTTTVEPGRSG